MKNDLVVTACAHVHHFTEYGYISKLSGNLLGTCSQSVCVCVAVYMHSSTRDTTVTSDRGRVECIDVYTRVKIEDEVVIYFDIHDG